MSSLVRKSTWILTLTLILFALCSKASQDNLEESGQLERFKRSRDFDNPSVYNFSGKSTSQNTEGNDFLVGSYQITA